VLNGPRTICAGSLAGKKLAQLLAPNKKEKAKRSFLNVIRGYSTKKELTIKVYERESANLKVLKVLDCY
jgi:hypothetical protein